MNMKWVHVSRRIDERPYLRATGFWIFGDRFMPTGISKETDLYIAIGRTLFLRHQQHTFPRSICRVQCLEWYQRIGQRAGVLARKWLRYFEEHYIFSQILTSHRIGSRCIIDQREGSSCKLCEIDHNIETLSWCDKQIVQIYGNRQQTTIRSNLIEDWDLW